MAAPASSNLCDHYAWPTSGSARADAPYTKGQRVEVYYEEDVPGNCYLKPKLSLGVHAFLWPVIFVVAGVFFIAKSFFFEKRPVRPRWHETEPDGTQNS